MVHPFNTVSVRMNLATATGNTEGLGFVPFFKNIVKQVWLSQLRVACIVKLQELTDHRPATGRSNGAVQRAVGRHNQADLLRHCS